MIFFKATLLKLLKPLLDQLKADLIAEVSKQLAALPKQLVEAQQPKVEQPAPQSEQHPAAPCEQPNEGGK